MATGNIREISEEAGQLAAVIIRHMEKARLEVIVDYDKRLVIEGRDAHFADPIKYEIGWHAIRGPNPLHHQHPNGFNAAVQNIDESLGAEGFDYMPNEGPKVIYFKKAH